ncbi:MAG: class I SAM-dependent methyltransferase [Myxococcota bacterium]
MTVQSGLTGRPPDAIPEDAETARYYALTRRVFGALAPVYDTVVKAIAQPSLRRRAVDFCQAPTGARVLDVATGTGAAARAFAERGHEVVAIDLVDQMLAAARRKGGSVRYELMDATTLAFPDRSFDVTTISFALHDMPGPIRARVLAEMARVTRQDGRVLVVDYGTPSHPLWARISTAIISTWERGGWYSEFLREDLSELLGRAGFVADAQAPAGRGTVRMIRGHPAQS